MNIWGILGTIGGSAATLWAMVKLIFPTVRTIARVIRKFVHFIDDWFGDEEAGKPGVIARLDATQKAQERQENVQIVVIDYLERIDHELHPNSGHSLRDALDRVEWFVNPEEKNSSVRRGHGR